MPFSISSGCLLFADITQNIKDMETHISMNTNALTISSKPPSVIMESHTIPRIISIISPHNAIPTDRLQNTSCRFIRFCDTGAIRFRLVISALKKECIVKPISSMVMTSII